MRVRYPSRTFFPCIMSAAPRRYEKSYSDIITDKLMGGIQRTEFVDTKAPIQRRIETYEFKPAMLFSSSTGIPLFLVQFFNFSAPDDQFTVGSVMHADDDKLLCDQLIHDQPTPPTWIDQEIAKDADGSYAIKRSVHSVYRLKLRNLWVDGGVLCNIFSSTSISKPSPDGSHTPLNKVNVIGAYASIDFDFKVDPSDLFLEFAIAPQIAHGVSEMWSGATWSVETMMGITHTDRDARKTLFKKKVIMADQRSDKSMKAKKKQPAAMAAANVVELETATTECNPEVNTRVSNIPVDFNRATVVRLMIQ